MKTSTCRTYLLLPGAASFSVLAAEIAPLGGKIEVVGLTKVMTVARVDQASRGVALRAIEHE